MSVLETVSTNRSHGGVQGVYRHASDACACNMTFAVFVPPQAAAAEHGVIIVCPDTSPRGDNVPDEADNWQFGAGAGFYLDATRQPWSKNYRMYSYVTEELPGIIAGNFSTDMARQSIFGHSMGGHGAMTIALKHADRFKSCSAFAPIVEPSTADWSATALGRYLGDDQKAWRAYDTCSLIADGKRFPAFLVDQGQADDFLDDGLRPWLLEEAVKETGIDLTVRMQDGYDHSYYFISSFMADHIAWHAERLAR